MAYVIINEKHLTAIADELRKLGGKPTYKPREMAPAIEALGGGGYGGLLGKYFKGVEVPGAAFEAIIEDCINEDGTLFIPEDMWVGKTIVGNVVVPFGIVEIPDELFKDVEGITSIEFPVGLASIGNSAFQNAINSDNIIVIGTDVESIGDYAFADSDFKELVLNDNLTSIGEYAFANNKTLTTVTGTLDQLSKGMFSGCSNLTNIDLDDNLETITENAFTNTAITNITIPPKVTTIEDSAFKNCALTNVEFPEGLQTIENSAFENCQLSEVTFPTNLSSIGNRAFAGSIGYDMPAVDLVLPPNATIGFDAFSYCNLKNITLPDTMTSFPGDCFGYATISGKVTFSPNVTSIGGGSSVYWEGAILDLPSTVTRIGNGAFQRTTNVGVYLPSSIESIGDYAFAETYCGSFKEGFGDNLKSIGDYAFSQNINISGINLGNQLTYLGDGAFEYTNLSKITIPSTLTEIGDNAFRKCEYLGKVQLSEGLQKIGDNAFAETAITSIDLPSTLTEIGRLAFYDTGITSIDLPSSLTEIGDNAFAYCENLTGDITLPSGVTTLEQSVFKNTGITSITLNEGLKTIDGYCLENTPITQLYCPASLETFYVEAFGRKVDNYSNTLYNSVNRIEFNLSPDHQLTLGKRSSYYDGQLVMRKLSGIDANKIIFKGQNCMIPKATNNSIFSHPSVNHPHTLISVPWDSSENPPGFPWGATNASIDYKNGL